MIWSGQHSKKECREFLFHFLLVRFGGLFSCNREQLLEGSGSDQVVIGRGVSLRGLGFVSREGWDD